MSYLAAMVIGGGTLVVIYRMKDPTADTMTTFLIGAAVGLIVQGGLRMTGVS